LTFDLGPRLPWVVKMDSLTPEEIEFIAEREPIRIVPNFNLGKLFLIAGDIGPFKPGLPVQVPLWVALSLKHQAKCRILIPDWMDVTYLEGLKQLEIDSETFTRMPNEHYMVISKLLFQCCSSDIAQADILKTLIKDIWDIRSSKLRTSVKNFIPSDNSYAIVAHLTMMEIASIRPFFPHALEQIYRLKKTVEVAKETLAHANSQSQSMSMTMNNSMSSSDTQ